MQSTPIATSSKMIGMRNLRNLAKNPSFGFSKLILQRGSFVISANDLNLTVLYVARIFHILFYCEISVRREFRQSGCISLGRYSRTPHGVRELKL